MKIAIMQPYIFPYIGYFQLINAVDKFIILDDVNYINKGWINRNRILTNGKEYLFTIPLKDASQNKQIREIFISDDLKWQNKFLKTIEMSYKKSPQFNTVYPIIISILKFKEKNISLFIYNSISLLNEYLNIKTNIVESSIKYNNTLLKAQDKIIDICLKEKVTTYINPIGGQELYNRDVFNSNNIVLKFIQSENLEYKQFNSEFVPWLSIIDILMFNSKEKIKDLLTSFKLI